MSAESDQVKGKVKQAAGIVTGDTDLESEGRSDRRIGQAKEKIEDAKGNVEELIETAKDKVEEVIDKGEDALHRK